MPDIENRPLFVQNDFTIMLETEHPKFEAVREELSRFADLVKSPANLHTYRVTPLSLWNAAAAGAAIEEIVDFLSRHSKFGVPPSILTEMERQFSRYGLIRLERRDGRLLLVSDDPELLKDVLSFKTLQRFFMDAGPDGEREVAPEYRGVLKQELARLGYPVDDTAGYHDGEALDVALIERLPDNRQFQLRDYQIEAVRSFYREGSSRGGSGVIVLPCGAGKTVIGIAAMAGLHCATLILTTNVTSVRQWKKEILEKTNLTEESIGEYGGDRKEVRPVTIATYQILTHRKTKSDLFRHMQLFNERDWGLIIYDEVHLLPAPVFRVTAEIQATRRLGLTATLVREDGCEEDVFSLVGPKRYDLPWKRLESEGWIARVSCTEIRAPMPSGIRDAYLAAEPKQKYRIASENPLKLDVIRRLLLRHKGEPTLIIGQYLDQLKRISEETGAPLISGEMPHNEREIWFGRFRRGELDRLVVSKVANFAVDLPDAAVAIEVSGSYGSRQEEAQRLGRILRPKAGRNEAHFYSVVSIDTNELNFALNRQLFLVEQGYRYEVADADSIMAGEVQRV